MKNLITRISTQRLAIRLLDISDAKDLQSLLANNREYMIPWIPWAVNEPETVEVKKATIRTWKGQFYLDQKYSYGIFEAETKRLAGLIFLLTRQGPGILEIGYIIDHAAAGKGYATEASYAMSRVGFSHVRIDKIEIHCSPANAASARVPEKLGYHLEGLRRLVERDSQGSRSDHMVWSLFLEEFKLDQRYEPVKMMKEKGW